MTNETQTEKVHKCLSNMQEHKLSECPSLRGFKEIELREFEELNQRGKD